MKKQAPLWYEADNAQQIMDQLNTDEFKRTVVTAEFGYCPFCNKPGNVRNENSNIDICVDSHIFPSNTAIN